MPRWIRIPELGRCRMGQGWSTTHGTRVVLLGVPVQEPSAALRACALSLRTQCYSSCSPNGTLSATGIVQTLKRPPLLPASLSL